MDKTTMLVPFAVTTSTWRAGKKIEGAREGKRGTRQQYMATQTDKSERDKASVRHGRPARWCVGRVHRSSKGTLAPLCFRDQ